MNSARESHFVPPAVWCCSRYHMPKISAGIIAYRWKGKDPEVFLVHPGGPFWAKKDSGAWSIPKGEVQSDEEPIDAAEREFREETGQKVESRPFPLPVVKQSGSKIVYPFALEQDIDPESLDSNTVSLRWPPKSGKHKEFPEVDRGEWFSLESAEVKIIKGQRPVLRHLAEALR